MDFKSETELFLCLKFLKVIQLYIKYEARFTFQKMAIRRTWTEDQDLILKMLKEQREVKKWNQIARIMDIQYHLPGRTGKQCRQRYNNHLDEQIVQQEFSYQNQKLLEKLHHEIGNKWAIIATHFKGRTANFLKNQMYSKLRKAVRRLNKYIKDQKIKKSTKQFKLTIVFKIIQTNDYKFCEKQDHSKDDLIFYEEIKKTMFQYAQEKFQKGFKKCEDPVFLQTHQQNSKKLIQLLQIFLTKFSFFRNKRKINKKYINEDEIIINSLSNNPQPKKNDKVSNILKQSLENQCQSESSDQKESLFSMRALNKIELAQSQNQNQSSSLRMNTSNTIDKQKYRECSDSIEKQMECSSLKKTSGKMFNEIQKIIVQNQKVTESIQASDISKSSVIIAHSAFQDQIFQEQSDNHQQNYMDMPQYADSSLFH